MKKLSITIILLSFLCMQVDAAEMQHFSVGLNGNQILGTDMTLLQRTSSLIKEQMILKERIAFKANVFAACLGLVASIGTMSAILFRARTSIDFGVLAASARMGMAIGLGVGWGSSIFLMPRFIAKAERRNQKNNFNALITECTKQRREGGCSLWGRLFLPRSDYWYARLNGDLPFECELRRRDSGLRDALGLRNLDGDDAISNELREQIDEGILTFVRTFEGKRQYHNNLLINTYYRLQHWVATSAIARLVVGANSATTATTATTVVRNIIHHSQPAVTPEQVIR